MSGHGGEPLTDPNLPNYRALLVRYMARILDSESVDYIEYCGGYYVELTEFEKAELLALVPEARQLLDKEAQRAHAKF